MNSLIPITLTQAMAADDPRSTNRALVESLPPTVELQLDFGPMMFPDKGEPYKTFLGCNLLNQPRAEDLAQARSILNLTLTPMSPEECVKLLTEIKISMRPQQLSAEEHEAQITIYCRDLLEYPADIVRKVLRKWRREKLFWPTPSELLESIEKPTGVRRAMLRALDAAPKNTQV